MRRSGALGDPPALLGDLTILTRVQARIIDEVSGRRRRCRRFHLRRDGRRSKLAREVAIAPSKTGESKIGVAAIIFYPDTLTAGFVETSGRDYFVRQEKDELFRTADYAKVFRSYFFNFLPSRLSWIKMILSDQEKLIIEQS